MSAGERAGNGPLARELRESRSEAVARARQAAHPGSAAPFLALLLVLVPGAALGKESTLEFEGGMVVLGRSEEFTATVHLGEEEEGPPLPLRLAASVGAFGEARRVRAGVWSVPYVPPKARTPQVAIAALWREGGPLQVEFLRFALHGSTRLPVKAGAGSRVTVEVAGRSFGPVEAGADGQAVVPLVVPPGARQAVANVRGQIGATLRTIELETPDGNRLVAVALRPPHAVGNNVPARLLVVYDPLVPVFDRRRILVTPSEGTVAWEKSSGNLHAYRWTPPGKLQSDEIAFDVAVEGDASSRYRTELSLAPPAKRREPSPRRWGGESIVSSPRTPTSSVEPRPPAPRAGVF